MKKNLAIISIGLSLYMTTQCINTLNASHDKNSNIIEEALKLELQPTNTDAPEEIKQLAKSVKDKMQTGKCEEAIGILMDGLRQFPQDFTLQFYFAALIGDYPKCTSTPLKNALIQRSRTLFEKLLKEADSQPKEIRYPFKNEYCFHNDLFCEQYECGVARVADYWGTDEWLSIGVKGYYCQGVGAAHYARELIKQGNSILAAEYAQKAVIAWAQYFTYDNTHYNPYVHYALALGILGNRVEMMRALERSASLINKDLGYFEFKGIIDFVESI